MLMSLTDARHPGSGCTHVRMAPPHAPAGPSALSGARVAAPALPVGVALAIARAGFGAAGAPEPRASDGAGHVGVPGVPASWRRQARWRLAPRSAEPLQ